MRIMLRRSVGVRYSLFEVSRLSEAESLLQSQDFNLIILDLSLPDGNGLDFLAKVKKNGFKQKVPVLILSSSTDVSQKVLGFSLGAEDYVTKPFDTLELLARIDSKVKKHQLKQEDEGLFSVEDLLIDPICQRVYVQKENEKKKELDLTPLEFKVLSLFARKLDVVFSRDQLIDQLWGESINITDRTVDTHMSHLRKKLKQGRSCLTIKGVYGVGYRFCVTGVEHKKNAA